MAGVKFTTTVDGVPDLERAFRNIKSSIEDFSPVFKEVQTEFYRIERDNFQSENAQGASGRWKPLSPKYEEAKIKSVGTFALLAGVLIRTEALYLSLTSADAPDSVAEIGKTEAAFGTSLPYAQAHQQGNSAKNLPARPPIDFSEPQQLRLKNRFKRGLIYQMQGRGLYIDETNFRDLG